MGIVRVIISKNNVYTTTHNTIIYKGELHRDETEAYLTDKSWDEINRAQSVAWSYATDISFNVNIKTLEVHNEIWSNENVFDYLQKLN